MIFTIQEIRYYLEKQTDLKSAIANLIEQAIVDCIPVDDFLSLNFKKTEENILKYEAFIGMTKRKEEQRTLYNNTNHKQGRYWLACNPRWIKASDDRKDTKYEIGYWVNYGDNNTYGWFTVEQIQQWFDNPDIQLHQIGGTKER